MSGRTGFSAAAELPHSCELAGEVLYSTVSAEYVPDLVSVVVPAYNRADIICDALDSVAAQTYRPIELVIVDDGSTDDTVEVVAQWLNAHRTDERFTGRILQQPNGGAASARNHGLREARGEFLVFLDSDDYYAPTKVQLQVEALRKHPEWLFCYGPVVTCEGASKQVFGARSVTWREATLRQMAWPFFHTMGPMMRREAVRRTGLMDERHWGTEDWEYHSRLALRCPSFGWTPHAVAYYRDSDDSRQRFRIGKERFRSEGFLRARLLLLEAIWSTAQDSYRRERRFRNAFCWHLLRILRTWFEEGYEPEVLEAKLSEVGRVSGGTPVRLLVRAMRAAEGWRGRYASFSLLRWVDFSVYKVAAVRSRLVGLLPGTQADPMFGSHGSPLQAEKPRAANSTPQLYA